MKTDLKKLAKLIRYFILTSTTKAGSGHPTSALSSVEIGVTLFEKYFHFDVKNPHNLLNDRLILSKGHAAPLLYTLFALSGSFPREKLNTLRKINSPLEGHPNPRRVDFVDVATGSLGQGLSVGAGMALSAKKDSLAFKTYVILGDGELAEGSIWEAANFSAYYKLSNLIAIADINRFGQSQVTMFQHKIEEYAHRFSAFGWKVLTIDGHNFQDLDRAFNLAVNNKSDKPVIIIAKTLKGKGVSFLEDKDNWHGKVLKEEDLEKALKELGEIDKTLQINLLPPKRLLKVVRKQIPNIKFSYKIGDQKSTREAYGEALEKLAKLNSLIYSLDADVKNSTYAEFLKNSNPDQFIECFIAEQNMVGVALGLSKLGKIPFTSTFACFLTRAFDQIRMAAISKGNIKFVGSHAGISIGEDGPSQMGLEDIAMFRTLPESVVFYPSDAVATAKLVEEAARYEGIVYLRTTRKATPIIYQNYEQFPVGGSKVIRQSKKDLITVIGAGITLHEALAAYEKLKDEGIMIRVIDLYSIKPLDIKTLKKAAKETKAIIIVEDHYEAGGIGEAVSIALVNEEAKIYFLAVRKMPKSGRPQELLEFEEISADAIVKLVKEII